MFTTDSFSISDTQAKEVVSSEQVPQVLDVNFLRYPPPIKNTHLKLAVFCLPKDECYHKHMHHPRHSRHPDRRSYRVIGPNVSNCLSRTERARLQPDLEKLAERHQNGAARARKAFLQL
jgi:hypothetical protein